MQALYAVSRLRRVTTHQHEETPSTKGTPAPPAASDSLVKPVMNASLQLSSH
jgi:hypothetical protein